MIEVLFPRKVVTLTAREADVRGAPYPEEMDCVRRAVPKRKKEFACGRILARQALERLGITDFPLVKGPDRAPVWPEGIVGSISHAAGLCGIAVARRSSVAALGLDIETTEPLSPELRPLVCTPGELEWIARAPRLPASDWPKLLFCAKESVYKCVYTLTGQQLEFHDIRIRRGPVDGECRASLLAPLPDDSRELQELSIRFFLEEDFLFTGLCIPGPS